MKAATFVFLLLVCGTVTGAQSSSVAAGDITIRISAGSPDYCIGASANVLSALQNPEAITLRLPLKLRYETQRYEKIHLSAAINFFVKAAMPGQSVFNVMRRGGGGVTDVDNRQFSTIVVERAASATGPDLVQCLSANDPGCISDFVQIPVLNRSAGVDLRGKTVRIMTTRDHTLPPAMIVKWKEKLKDSGIVFSGVADSEVLEFRIPDEPLARDCTPPARPR